MFHFGIDPAPSRGVISSDGQTAERRPAMPFNSDVDSNALLAWMNHRLEQISETQHRLAVHRAVLQEQATRLRLGVAPDEVASKLRNAGLEIHEASRTRRS
jgi:hypothetical protein